MNDQTKCDKRHIRYVQVIMTVHFVCQNYYVTVLCLFQCTDDRVKLLQHTMELHRFIALCTVPTFPSIFNLILGILVILLLAREKVLNADSLQMTHDKNC